MPLEVYADWLEERGDERAVGARWLADAGKEPVRLRVGWFWPSLDRSPAGLPFSIRELMPRGLEPFPSFPDALFSAVNAATERLGRVEINEFEEALQAFEERSGAGMGYAELLAAGGMPLAEGMRTLVQYTGRPGRNGDEWLWRRRTGRGWPRAARWLHWWEHLPSQIFDRLTGGRLSGTVREYATFREAIEDAARVLEAET